MKGFSAQNLWNMRYFYLEYHENEKLQTLSREIGWSHNVAIFQKAKDNLEREFYIKMVIKFGWTYRVLDNHIDNKSYEKFLLNQTNFDKTVEQKYKEQAKLAVKDIYNYDFLELGEEHSEHQVYKLTESLPIEFQNLLPTSTEISQRLEKLFDNNDEINKNWSKNNL